MRFNLDKEKKEIAKLNIRAKLHIEEGKRLNERAKKTVKEIKELLGMVDDVQHDLKVNFNL